jgi:hypothetical protein
MCAAVADVAINEPSGRRAMSRDKNVLPGCAMTFAQTCELPD